MSVKPTSGRALLVAAVVSLAMTGCAGKSPGAGTPASASPVTPASASSVSSAPAAASTSPSPTAPAVDQTIRVTYAGGKVVGGAHVVTVKHNSTVALVVTSDTADEVHFHGYDKHADVAKGGTVTIVFKATLQGRFIAELEKLGRRLVTIQVP